MLEAIAETDEALLEKYLGDEELAQDELVAALRKGTIDGNILPVLCGSAFKNKGVQNLLDAVVAYLPSPVDIPPVQGVDVKTGDPVVRKATESEPFSALAFKIMTDPYVGKLTYFRVYSGVVDQGQSRQSTRPRTARSGWAASCRCTPTTARTSTRPSPATSSRRSG